MKNNKPAGQGIPPPGEKIFDISVPVCVKGKNAAGNIFNERTRLKNISSEIAIFSLGNKIIVGSKLQLQLNIPKTLILKNKLMLLISGEVARVRRDSENGGGQIVDVVLTSSYKIKEIEKRDYKGQRKSETRLNSSG